MERGTRLTKERLEAMLDTVKEVLSEKERELFAYILYNREAALAWEFTKCGRIRLEVVPPQEIRTVDYTAW